MTRIMVNMAKVNTTELAQETGLPTEYVEKVVKQIIDQKNNHRREPKPPAPKGGINLSQASRKYGIHQQTLSRWVAKGYIPVLLRTKNELYVDKNTLAEMVRIYRENPGQGRKTILSKIKQKEANNERKTLGNASSPLE